VKASFTLTNLSTRPLPLALGVRTLGEGAAAVDFSLRPGHITLAKGKSVLVRLNAITASAPSGDATAEGTVVVAVRGGGGIRIPWAIAFGRAGVIVALDRPRQPSGRRRAMNSSLPDAERAAQAAAPTSARPAAGRGLYRSNGAAVGLLARLRTCCRAATPSASPAAARRAAARAGNYELRLRAFPVDQGPPHRRRLRFSVR
jgi:hypothetical protein